MLDIRLANPDDAEAIHLILQETWGDSLLFDVFIDHISSPDHQVLIATDGGEVAGFLSAFLVPSTTPRWETDLIIVRSTSQGKGIGTSLIERALTYGSNLKVPCAAASIRVDNYASQRAFSKTGFETNAQVQNLLLWEPLAYKSITQVVNGVHLIPVNTLLYRGLWIEGFIESQLPLKRQDGVIRAAQNQAFHENRLNTGLFIPESLKQTIALDLLADASHHGQYHRWQYAFK